MLAVRERSGRGRTVVAALALAATLVSTGCLRGSASITIEEDRSGRIEFELEPSVQLVSQLETMDLGGVIAAASGARVDFEDVGRSGRPKYRVTASFDDYRSLTDPVNGVAIAGRTVVLFNSFDLQEGDDGWRLDAQLRPLDDVLGSGGLAGDVGLVLPDESPAVKLLVTLPGRVASTNAPTFDGGTASWDIDQLAAPIDLRMQTQHEPFPNPAQLALGVGALTLVAGVALLLVGVTRTPRESKPGRRGRRRRRRRSKASDGGWESGAGAEDLVPAATVPLPWQTVKPSEEAARSARPPLGPDGSIIATPPTSSTPEHAGAPTAAAPDVVLPDPGWYADPETPSRMRWWDGSNWTEHVQ